MSRRLEELQEKIGIAFRDPGLLLEALTHSSFANENPHVSPRDNERLEYLGDAVLQLISAEYLYKVRPEAKEGEMTQVRSAMVNTNTLAALSEELGIGNYLYLGKGIAKGGGRNLRSLLANTFEAVLGAIFLDAGYDAAYHYCLERFKAMPDAVQDENHKGRLQQVVQERFGVTPYYDSVGARGQAGRMREYTAVVYAGGDPLGTGHGQSKQTAEQSAAKDALEKLLGTVQQGKRPRRTRRRRADEQPAPGLPAVSPSREAEPGLPAPVESVLPQLEPRPEPIEAAVEAAIEAAENAPPPPAPRSRRRRSKPAQPPAASPEPPAARSDDATSPQASSPGRPPDARPEEARPRQLGEPLPAQESQTASAPETVPDAAGPSQPGEPPQEPEAPAPTGRPRRSRSRAPAGEANGFPSPGGSRRRARPGAAAEEPVGEAAPQGPASEPEASPAQPAPAEPARSRQFGEPL
jgi:ribonuclease-3